jgi:alkylhydroperoxidase family enzyme
MTSTSTFRIPKAEITGAYGALMKMFAKRMLDDELPDNLYVYFHNKPVLKAVMSSSGKVRKREALDPTLSSYAQLASAGVIGCSWCLDFGYFMAHNDGLVLAKVREVPRWRESDVFTPLERDVLEYAEAMTATPPGPTGRGGRPHPLRCSGGS